MATDHGSPAAPGCESDLELQDGWDPALDDEGLDRSLIRESLARSPLERLDLADAYAQEIEALRACVRTGQTGSAPGPRATRGDVPGEP